MKLKDFYAVYLAALRKEEEERSRKVIQYLSSRFQRILRKEEAILSQKLNIIRRKLAILVVAKHWRKKKLSYRIFRDKIIKVRRRLNALRAKETYHKSMTMPLGRIEDKIPTSDNKVHDEDIDLLLDEDHKEAELRKAREKQLKQKILGLSKKAYKVELLKLPLYSPFLAVDLDNESEVAQPEVFNPTTAYLQGMSSRAVPPNSRATQLMNPIRLAHKRFFYPSCTNETYYIPERTYTHSPTPIRIPKAIEDARFMKLTLAQLSRISPSEYPPKTPLKKIGKKKQKYLKAETITYSLKKRKAAEIRENSSWNMYVRSEERYSPSIYNLSYTPQEMVGRKSKGTLSEIKSKKSSNITLVRNKNVWSSSVFSKSPSTMDASATDIQMRSNKVIAEGQE
jgi:hypothetical protein